MGKGMNRDLDMAQVLMSTTTILTHYLLMTNENGR